MQDERLWMGIHKTDSGRFLVVNLGGKQQNESWVLDLEGALAMTGWRAGWSARCNLPHSLTHIAIPP